MAAKLRPADRLQLQRHACPVAAPEVVTYAVDVFHREAGPESDGPVRPGWHQAGGKPEPNFGRHRTAGGSWAELQVINPVARTSDKGRLPAAVRQLLVSIYRHGGRDPGGQDRRMRLKPSPADFTAAGVIRVAKAATVTHYWALSSGRDSAVTTLTFHRAGTQAVRPLRSSSARRVSRHRRERCSWDRAGHRRFASGGLHARLQEPSVNHSGRLGTPAPRGFVAPVGAYDVLRRPAIPTPSSHGRTTSPTSPSSHLKVRPRQPPT